MFLVLSRERYVDKQKDRVSCTVFHDDHFSPQEADISLGPFAITPGRFAAVDYTHYLFNDYASMIKSKGLPEIDPWDFLFPLAPLVWAGLLAALMVAWLAVVVLGQSARSSGRVTWASQLFFQHLRIVLRQGKRTLFS